MSNRSLIKKAEKLVSINKAEALDILTRIATGDLMETKQTAHGEKFESPPPAKDRKDAIALIAKIEGWVGEDGEKDSRVLVGILKPSKKGEE